MPRLRVHNFSVSIDGYAAGPDQGPDDPLGVGGMRLHEWAFATPTFGAEGDGGIDEQFASRMNVGIGATIQQYLAAGLIDEMHVAISPLILGSGERLFDNLDGGLEGYTCELTSSPTVVHAVFTRS